MKRSPWLWLTCIFLLLAGSYLVAAPWLTVRAIERAAMENRSIAIIRRVDFPALRSSLKIQFNDYLVRRTGADVQASRLGQLRLRGSALAVGAAVDASVNPAGLASFMQGRKAYAWLMDGPEAVAGQAPAEPARLLEGARYRYRSPSHFTVTIHDEAGRPTVLVLTRRGLRWRLTDIRLPLSPENASAGV